MNWYLNKDGEAEGPHDEAAMVAMIAEGRIGPESLVWQPSMQEWREAKIANEGWWRAGAAEVAEVAPSKPALRPIVISPQSETVRRPPIPSAPTGSLPPPPQRGFFGRLFGFGRKGSR